MVGLLVNGWLVGRRPDRQWLVSCVVAGGWLVGQQWLAGWLVGWLVNSIGERLGSWLAGWLRSCGWLVGLFVRYMLAGGWFKYRNSKQYQGGRDQ